MSKIMKIARPLSGIIIAIALLVLIFVSFGADALAGPSGDLVVMSIIIILVAIPSYAFGGKDDRIIPSPKNKKEACRVIQGEAMVFLTSILLYILYRFLLFDVLQTKSEEYSFFAVVLLVAFWIFLSFSIVRFIFSVVDSISSVGKK